MNQYNTPTEDEYLKSREVLKSFIRKSTPLLISFPYMDQITLEKIYNEREKRKRISKKDFVTFIKNHDYEKQFIPNYVTTSQSKPENAKFRLTRKSKWLNKLGFIFANGKDLILKESE